MTKPDRKRDSQLPRALTKTALYMGMAVALVIGCVALYSFSYHWGLSHRSLLIRDRSWLLLILVVSGIGIIAYSVMVVVMAAPSLKGLVNERLGHTEQAARYYRYAIKRYMHGGFFPIRNALRIIGVSLFFWKYDMLDLRPEEQVELIKDTRSVLRHLRHNFIWHQYLRLPAFRSFSEILVFMETALLLPERIDNMVTGRLARMEASIAEDDEDNLGRGMSLLSLGYYKDATEAIDRAIRFYEQSADMEDPEDTELIEIARFLGALAAWAASDWTGCELRLRGLRLADPELRLQATGLEAALASAQGKPEEALAIFEQLDSDDSETSVDPDVLAWLASARAEALNALGRFDDALTYARQAAVHFQKENGPIMAWSSWHEVALALKGLGRNDEALAVIAGAAAELDIARYQLGHMSSRVTFAGANDKARALALELAIVSAPRLAAELVECARVQGLPTEQGDDRLRHVHIPMLGGQLATASAHGRSAGTFSANNTSLSAARTATGMAPLTPPPRLSLFAPGDSNLGRLVQEQPSAGQVVLAEVAEAVAGNEWWWWGSWAVGGQLYWSLIGHDGTVEAGAIPLASLEPVLSRLAAALPSLLIDETDGNVGRARSGALACPDTGILLANELGQLLIPPTLKDLVWARATSGHPLSLVVAPAPGLGQVPFGLLGLGDAGIHLAHGAVVRLGASAALLDQIRRRRPGPFDRRVLCVIDPCGKEETDPAGKRRDFSLLADDELKQIGVMDWAWLQDGMVLSRSGHLPELHRGERLAKRATSRELGKALRTRDAGVLAYIGHVSNGSDDVPANASLVLDDDFLSARNLLYDTERMWPMPPRVALIGCGSAGASAPEWLGLAPASLWAGAQIVAATSWDLIDEADTWKLADEVVNVLYQAADPAAEWRERFIHHLAEWKTKTGPSPLSWGAIQIVGLAS